MVKPIDFTFAPWRSRSSWPRFNSPRSPISVARASPRCELCAHTAMRGFTPLRCAEKLHQRIEGVGHVGVADVPRRVAAAKHRAVILLGVGRQPRVLLGEKEFVFGAAVRRATAYSAARLRSSVSCWTTSCFARLGDAGRDCVAVGVGVAGEMIEARIAIARAPGQRRDRPCRDMRSPPGSSVDRL